MNQIKRKTGKILRRADKIDRQAGRLLRLIAKLDQAWRLAGQQEGRLENRLAFELGNAARNGMYDESRQIQCLSAAQLGQRSGWERD